MKKLVLLTAAVLSFATMQANHLNSELNLKMYDNSLFTVTFDNTCYNAPSYTFGLGNITPGNHFLKISKKAYKQYGHCNMPKIIFCGYVNIPVNTKLFAMIDFYNNFNVVNMLPNFKEPVCDKGHHNKGGYGHKHGYDDNDMDEEENDLYLEDKDYGYNHKNNDHCYKPSCMNMNEFNMLKSSVANKSFDSSRLQIARQAIAANYLSSAQVAELVGLMTFESTKLDLAKFAYQYTVDRKNYYMVNNAFTFESSIQELVQYINKVG